MGAAGCKKCACDNTEDGVAAEAVPSQTAYNELVETKSPGVVEAKAPGTVGTAERPPEQTGGEPDIKVGPLRTLLFELEASKPLGARFSQIVEPEATGGTLVTSSIAEKSPLAITKDGFVGICAGDVIVKVAGQVGPKHTLLELLTKAKGTGGKLEVQVRQRPAYFDVLCTRSGEEKMGIVVAVHDDIPDRVEVRQGSEEGAVPWLNENSYMHQVVSGDWVTMVGDGPAGKAATDMLSDMQTAWTAKNVLKIRIMSWPTNEMRDKQVAAQ